MNSNGILHLTVNSNGTLSLWDDAKKATDGKQSDEVQIQLSLTQPQRVAVLKAEQIARQKAQDRKCQSVSRS